MKIQHFTTYGIYVQLKHKTTHNLIYCINKQNNENKLTKHLVCQENKHNKLNKNRGQELIKLKSETTELENTIAECIHKFNSGFFAKLIQQINFYLF